MKEKHAWLNNCAHISKPVTVKVGNINFVYSYVHINLRLGSTINFVYHLISSALTFTIVLGQNTVKKQCSLK